MTPPKQTPEYLYSEKPTFDQLQSMGWQYIEGDWEVPDVTERDTFKQVLLKKYLREALKTINPWLDDSQVETAVTTLERQASGKALMEMNQSITELLQQGTTAQGADGKDVTVHYVDFEYIDKNNFLCMNQFRVDPPWSTGNKGFCVPDIVLFVNGIPSSLSSAKVRNSITPSPKPLPTCSNIPTNDAVVNLKA